MAERKPIPYYRSEDELRRRLAALKSQSGVTVEAFVRDNSNDSILHTRAVSEGLR